MTQGRVSVCVCVCLSKMNSRCDMVSAQTKASETELEFLEGKESDKNFREH